jgi:acetyl-CoA C-acetyltransferase
VDQVLDSQLVADPLRLFDCSPVSDGASALIISKPEISKKYTDTPVYIYRTAQATGDISLYSRPLTEIQATKTASKKLFKNIDRKRVNMAEVHDCFTIEEIMALEDIGFCKKGEGWKIVNEAFDSFYDGAAKHIPYIINGEELVVNPRGGLKADGHPVSATGAAQAWSIFRQLRKDAGKNQVDLEPDLAITHNLGGTGGVVNMFLYGLDHRGV